MSFLDADNDDLNYGTLAATSRPALGGAVARHVIFSKEDERDRVELQDLMGDIKVVVEGTDFKIVQENGRLIVEPQDSSRVATWSVLFKDLESDDQRDKVNTEEGITGAQEVTSERVTSNDVTSEATTDNITVTEPPMMPEGHESHWKVMTPFTNRDIKNKNSYLVPQLLAIDIRPRVEEGVWRVPKTLIICSTRRALEYAKSKVEQVLSKLTDNGRDPDTQLNPVCPLITGEPREMLVPKLRNGSQPVLVCTPRYAKYFIRQNIEQVWWLNVRQSNQDWTDIDQLLQAFEELDGRFRSPIKVNVCFGREDKEEAARIMAWLEETKGSSHVTGFSKVRSDLEL